MKTETKTTAAPTFKMIPLSDIAIGKTNPRKDFDAETSQELIESVREKGVLQPVIVREKSGKYELVCGERRYRAAKAVQVAYKDRTTIPAMIRELSDDEVIELQIIENLQRKDVHPMEEAAAFKQLIEHKSFPIEEIAKRIGKSPSYVAGRLKLNSLIPGYQKYFFTNLISMTDGMAISKLSKASQEAMYEQKHKNKTSKIEISFWDMDRYKADLKRAPFDLKDASLLKEAGACTVCQHNTASNTLLFPDAAKSSQCLNVGCFAKKGEIAFSILMKKAAEDPSIIFISEQYTTGTESKEIVKTGVKVYAAGQYDELEEPELDLEYIDRDDFDSEKDYQDEIKSEKRIYEDNLKEYKADLASGKYIKAFVVEGSGKGLTKQVKLSSKKDSGNFTRPTAAQLKEKEKAGTVTSADIQIEIKRLNDAAKRKNEIEGENMVTGLVKLMEDNDEKFITTADLKPVEKIALIMSIANDHIMYDSVAAKACKLKDMDDLKKLSTLKPAELDKAFSAIIRAFILDSLNLNAQVFHLGKGNMADVLHQISNTYFPNEVKNIEKEKEEIMSKYDERLKNRIAALKAQLKPAKKK